MGLCLSAEEIEQKEISQNIDRGLEEDNRRLKKECKILLLGKFLTSCWNNIFFFYSIGTWTHKGFFLWLHN